MKSLAKQLAQALAFLAVLPWLLWTLLAGVVLGRSRALASASQRASRWGGLLGEYCRRALLRCLLGELGPDVVIGFGTVFSKPTARLGRGVYLGQYCTLGDVRIGPDTLLADHVCIPSGGKQHRIDRLDIPIRQQGGEFTPVTIGQDCWIGTCAVVLADVGDHAVVAAGAVVTRPVEPYAIVAGCPAKPIGNRRKQTDSFDGDCVS